MYTSKIQLGDLVEIIETGAIVCVLENLSNPTPAKKDNTEEFLESPEFLTEDGKVYRINEIRALPGNAYL